ncbi:MAG: hypothetical protein WC445_01260 [Patescibacteria group bacterium]
MADRETKTITTPAGHEVVLKEWVNGKEIQQIENLIYKNFDIQGARENPNFKLNTSFLTEQTNKTLELVVVSIDGKTENILEEILALKVKDYKFIVTEANKVIEGLDEEKKTA